MQTNNRLSCNVSFIWSLSQVSGLEFLEPGNSLSDRSVFVIHGGLLNNTPKFMLMR